MKAGDYSSADGTQRCARRGCSSRFTSKKHTPKSGRTKQRYCSAICRCYDYQLKHGIRGRTQFGMCKYGRHERTPENTVLENGMKRCKDCRNESQRRRRARLKAAA